MNKRGVIPAFFVALVVTAAVHADLMPMSPPAVAVSKNESADCRTPLAMTCCADFTEMSLRGAQRRGNLDLRKSAETPVPACAGMTFAGASVSADK